MQLRFLMFAAVMLFGSSLPAAEPKTPFAVKAGDVWVMAGDSITAQRQHSNYQSFNPPEGISCCLTNRRAQALSARL